MRHAEFRAYSWRRARGRRGRAHRRRRGDRRPRAGRPRVLFLDPARDRLFWLIPTYIALLHHHPPGDRRPPLQRHDGPSRLRAVPARRHADRHPPPVRGPASGRGFQVPALRLHRPRGASDAAHRVHHLWSSRAISTPPCRVGTVYKIALLAPPPQPETAPFPPVPRRPRHSAAHRAVQRAR